MSYVASRSDPAPRRDAEGAAAGRAATAPPFSSVDVHGDPRDVLDDWRALADAAPVSPYQSPEWLLPWIDTVGAELGIAPMIAVARDADGRAVALLPLGRERRGPSTAAVFLGAKDSNFNMGLFRPGRAWTAAALRDLLRRAAAAGGARIDLFALGNQPFEWQGTRNPMAALDHQPSPSSAYRATLLPDPEAFLRARLSRDTRKKMRQKANRLRALGPVSLVEAGTPGEAAELIGAFMVQRAARNAAAGIGGGELEVLRRFLGRTVGGGGPVSLYGLRCGERIVATLGGAHRGSRFSGMLTSFAAEPEFARTSPGELLLSEVMRRRCAAGDLVFDLGIGEARYKESFCPEIQPLFDSFLAVTPLGQVHAPVAAAQLRFKRWVKQSSWAWPLALRLRRILRSS